MSQLVRETVDVHGNYAAYERALYLQVIKNESSYFNENLRKFPRTRASLACELIDPADDSWQQSPDAATVGLSAGARVGYNQLLLSVVAPTAERKEFLALLSDPSIYHLRETYTALRGGMWWNPTAGEQLQEAVHVTRSLYWQSRAPTAEAILRTAEEVAERRTACAPIPIFEGRTVVHVTNNELISDAVAGYPGAADKAREYVEVSGDVYRFGKRGARVCIEQEARRAGGEYHFFRYEGVDAAGCALAKQDFIEFVATVKPGPQGFTAYLEGHGNALGASLSGRPADASAGKSASPPGHSRSADVKISPDELADALLKRAGRFPPKPGDPYDIVVIDACRVTLPLDGPPKEMGYKLMQRLDRRARPTILIFSAEAGTMRLRSSPSIITSLRTAFLVVRS